GLTSHREFFEMEERLLSRNFSSTTDIEQLISIMKSTSLVVKKTFNKLSANPTTTTKLVEKETAIFTGSKGSSWTNPDSIALMVIQAMLGSWKKVQELENIWG
ncbi:hypothetical protein Tco_0348270, partial [Tanacetum coccineum]